MKTGWKNPDQILILILLQNFQIQNIEYQLSALSAVLDHKNTAGLHLHIRALFGFTAVFYYMSVNKLRT